jgi:hypothetical protein
MDTLVVEGHDVLELAWDGSTSLELVGAATIVVGSGGDSTLNKIAAVPLNAYKLMTTDSNGQAVYADAATPAHVNRIIGLSITAASAGGTVRIQSSGQITNQGWLLPTGATLYAGLNGDLSIDSTVGAFSQIVGYVMSPNTIFLQPSLGILRAIF